MWWVFLTSWATVSGSWSSSPSHLCLAQSLMLCLPYWRTGPASTHSEHAPDMDLCWVREPCCRLLLAWFQPPSVVHVCFWLRCRQGQKPNSPVQQAHVLGCLTCCPAQLWVWCGQRGCMSRAWVCVSQLFASESLSLFGSFRAAFKSRHRCYVSFQSDISLPLGGGIRQLQKEHERRWEKAPGPLLPVEEKVPWPEAWL